MKGFETMANKTNAFSTRKNSKEKISKLWGALNEIWDKNNNAYQEYTEALEEFLRDNPYSTLDQIACALSDSPSEQRSIRLSVTGLATAATEARRCEKEKADWDALTPEQQAKMKRNYPFKDFPDSEDFNISRATFPGLDYKYITKTRHFVELDDNDNEISRFNTTEEKKVYFLQEYEN